MGYVRSFFQTRDFVYSFNNNKPTIAVIATAMKPWPFLFVFLLGATSAFAQKKFTISGTVSEKGSRELLPGVVVAETNLKVGTSTNNYGFYSITVAADSISLSFNFIGYRLQAYQFKLDKDLQLNVELLPDDMQLEEVVISAEEQRRISEETQMSSIDIPVEQIKKIPALFGEKDVLKVLQLLPGVQKGGEGNAGFYVRGGGPDQNLIILDDATLYNVNHLFGFFSLFNGDALKSVELIKGGFPARYGGRLSSVLELQMKDGNKEKLHGEAGIGLISSRLTLEGPLVKGKSSFIVSGRRTYIDALIYPLLPEDSKSGYFFYDFNAKANYTLNDRNRLYLSGYFGKDKFYFRPQDSFSVTRGSLQWGNATGTARWNHVFNPKTFANTSLIFSRYQLGIRLSEKDNDGFEFNLRYLSSIRDWSGKFDLDYRPNTKHTIRTGAIVTLHRFTPSALVVRGSDLPEEVSNSNHQDAIENGIYVEDDWKISARWKANVGMRVSHFNTRNKNYFGAEPRAAVRYMLNDRTSLKASYALMNQYLHLLSNTGIGLPTDLWVPATENIRPQRSQQWAIGLAKDLERPRLTVTLEGYYKEMNRIINYKEGATFLTIEDPANADEIPWEKNVTSGQGVSYGAELLVQKKFGKLTGWVGYTLSWTKLQFDSLNNGEWFYARFDRRHDASIVLMYEVNERFSVSATWVYGTGQAITLPQGSFIYGEHGTGPNYTFQNNGFIPGNGTDYGKKNDFRMEAYHRMDIAARWTKELKRSRRTFELGVYNVYCRWNPYFYYLSNSYDSRTNQYTNTLKKISLFPILPSVSWSWSF